MASMRSCSCARASSLRTVDRLTSRRRAVGLRSALWLLLAATAFTGCDSRDDEKSVALDSKSEVAPASAEEVKMGKPTSVNKQGRYAMRGPEDAANDDAAGAAPEPAEPEAPMREERARRTMKKSGRSMPKPSPADPHSNHTPSLAP